MLSNIFFPILFQGWLATGIFTQNNDCRVKYFIFLIMERRIRINLFHSPPGVKLKMSTKGVKSIKSKMYTKWLV